MAFICKKWSFFDLDFPFEQVIRDFKALYPDSLFQQKETEVRFEEERPLTEPTRKA